MTSRESTSTKHILPMLHACYLNSINCNNLHTDCKNFKMLFIPGILMCKILQVLCKPYDT